MVCLKSFSENKMASDIGIISMLVLLELVQHAYPSYYGAHPGQVASVLQGRDLSQDW